MSRTDCKISGVDINRSGNMPNLTTLRQGGELFNSMADCAIKNGFGRLAAEEGKNYTNAFSDADLVDTCLALFENDLNVSKTAGKLYMHRNTLIYRIGKLKRLTGLDVCKFSDAVTFLILYRCYRGGLV